jgi:hypothetical protein
MAKDNEWLRNQLIWKFGEDSREVLNLDTLLQRIADMLTAAREIEGVFERSGASPPVSFLALRDTAEWERLRYYETEETGRSIFGSKLQHGPVETRGNVLAEADTVLTRVPPTVEVGRKVLSNRIEELEDCLETARSALVEERESADKLRAEVDAAIVDPSDPMPDDSDRIEHIRLVRDILAKPIDFEKITGAVSLEVVAAASLPRFLQKCASLTEAEDQYCKRLGRLSHESEVELWLVSQAVRFLADELNKEDEES